MEEKNKELGSNITFDMPKMTDNKTKNVIKVIGVGGGGSNAVNHMYKQEVQGVDFVICNTDLQALINSNVPTKIQLGKTITEGLGAGSDPEVGKQAAMESLEEIEEILGEETKMVFITAGMGGGTGTGAAPIIANLAKEKGILTVAIVTSPFKYEGNARISHAQKGLEELRKNVDSLIIINNNKLREIYGKLGIKEAFSKADEVLTTATRSIAEIITKHFLQNIDLRDVTAVLSNSGTAIMGSAKAEGENRATEVIKSALDSPLLNDNKIKGAKNVLLLVMFGNEMDLDEIAEISEYVQQEAGYNANIIPGMGEDPSLGDAISVTIIATGFDVEQQEAIVNPGEKREIYHILDSEKTVTTEVFSKKPSEASVVSDNSFLEYSAGNSVQAKSQAVEKESEKKNNELTIFQTKNEANVSEIEVKEPRFIVKKQQEIFDNEVFFASNQSSVKEISNVEPTPEFHPEGEVIIHNLIDSFEKVENESKTIQKKEEFAEQQGEIELFITEATPEEEMAYTPGLLDISESEEIMNMPIEEVLKKRQQERKITMKRYNHKFNSNAIQLFDNYSEPAYKRNGVDLEETETSNISRKSISLDKNNDFQIRTNNSFLHDNVD